MRPDSVTTAGLAIAVLLAGCGGSSGPPSDDDVDPGDPLAGGSGNRTVLPFGSGKTETITLWMNATAVSSGNGVCFGCSAEVARIDLGPYVPSGQVVRIAASTRASAADGGGTFGGDVIDTQLEGEDLAIYTYSLSSSSSNNSHSMQATFSRGAALLELVVGWQAPDQNNREVEYTLRIDIDVDPSRLVARAPFIVQLEADQQVVIEPRSRGQDVSNMQADVWGPDDAHVARPVAGGTNLSWGPGPDAVSGDYVVHVTGVGGDLRVLKHNATGEQIRLARFVDRVGVLQEVSGEQPHTWTFDVTGLPVLVGIYLEIDVYSRPPSAPPSTATIESPAGIVFDGPVGCTGACTFSSSYRSTHYRGFADPALVAGSYTAVYDPGDPQPARVAEAVTTIER